MNSTTKTTTPVYLLSLQLLHLSTTALSQKGDPVESLKIFRIYEGAKGALGETYVLVDFG